MKIVRPSRRWPKLFKYYLASFFLISPFLYRILLEYKPETAFTLYNFFYNEIGSYIGGISFIDKYMWHMLILAVVLIVFAEIRRFRIKYIFYDDRVVKEVGLLITDIKDVSYDHIDYFHTKRNIVQRLLGTADLKFKTPGDIKSISLDGVGDPERWAEFIMKRANIELNG